MQGLKLNHVSKRAPWAWIRYPLDNQDVRWYMQNIDDGNLSNVDDGNLSNVDDGNLSNVDDGNLSNVDDGNLSNVDDGNLSMVQSCPTWLPFRNWYLYEKPHQPD